MQQEELLVKAKKVKPCLAFPSVVDTLVESSVEIHDECQFFGFICILRLMRHIFVVVFI